MRSYSLFVIAVVAASVAGGITGCGEDSKKPAPPRDTVVARPEPVAYDTGCVPPPPTRINQFVGWPEYDMVTTDLIACLPDTTLDRVIYLNAAKALGVALKRDSVGSAGVDDYMAFMRLPRGLRMVWSTWGLEMETTNGGFDQYFLNTSGAFAGEAIGGLRMIGATKVATLAQSAYDFWSAEQKRIAGDSALDLGGRKRYFDAIDSLTTRFNEASASPDRFDNVAWLRVQYVRRHPEEFVR